MCLVPKKSVKIIRQVPAGDEESESIFFLRPFSGISKEIKFESGQHKKGKHENLPENFKFDVEEYFLTVLKERK